MFKKNKNKKKGVPSPFNHLYVPVLGAKRVGKTCWVNNYVCGVFVDSSSRYYDPIMDDSYRKQIAVGERRFMLELEDFTPDHEYAQAMIDLYLKKGSAVLIFYSVLDATSLKGARDVYERATIKREREDLPRPWAVLVGTRIDEVSDSKPRAVSYEQGQQLAKVIGCVAFFESSAKNLENADKIIEALLAPAIAYEETTRQGYDPLKSLIPLPIPGYIPPPQPVYTMAEDLRSLIDNEKYSDITLSAEGRDILANRMILLTRNPSILEGFGPDDPKVTFDKVTYNALLAVVEWIYTGKFVAPPYGSEARKDMRTAAMRCKAYKLLPYLSIEEDAEEKEKEQRKREEEEAKLLSESDKKKATGPSFALIFNEAPFSDITFTFGSGDNSKKGETTTQKLLAHRILLVARSPYFRSMFEGGFKETRQSEIEIHDIDFNAFKVLLWYIYTDTIEGCPGVDEPGDVIQELLSLSEIYCLPGLKLACEVMLCAAIQVNNAVAILQLADQLDLEATRKYATQYISYRHSLVTKTDDFKRLSEEKRLAMQRDFQCGLWQELEEPTTTTTTTTTNTSDKKPTFLSKLRF